MARFTIALLVIAAVVLFADANPSGCGPNEQFNSCGTACPPTCSNPNPQICTMQCVIGCECKSGYLRNSANQCVPPSEC